jgi:hypothetical protein
MGVRIGDRVAIPFRNVRIAIAHAALYQIGAVALPLSFLSEPEGPALRAPLGPRRGAVWRAPGFLPVYAFKAARE